MEDIKAKKLIALYESDKDLLCGPVKKIIKISDDCEISIEQCGQRKIEIENEEEISFRELYAILTRVERMLLIFDGVFIDLKKIVFESSDNANDSHLESYAHNLLISRPVYYKSADFLNYTVDKLVDFDCILEPHVYQKWVRLLDDMGAINQVFMLVSSNVKMPNDMRCSFFIEMSESLVELVKEYTTKFSGLNPGGKGTALRQCIDALVKAYGKTIFHKELLLDYNQFLSALINCRINIMHIKRKQKKPCLNGKESVLYARKICLLYRHVMLSILGVEEKAYIDRLKIVVNRIDSWNDISDMFFSRISRNK